MPRNDNMWKVYQTVRKCKEANESVFFQWLPRLALSRVLKIYWLTTVFFQTRTVPSSLTPSSWPRITSSPPTPNQSYPSGRTCSSSARGFPIRSRTLRHISSPMQLRRKLWWAQTIATRWKHSLVLIICRISSVEYLNLQFGVSQSCAIFSVLKDPTL